MLCRSNRSHARLQVPSGALVIAGEGGDLGGWYVHPVSPARARPPPARPKGDRPGLLEAAEHGKRRASGGATPTGAGSREERRIERRSARRPGAGRERARGRARSANGDSRRGGSGGRPARLPRPLVEAAAEVRDTVAERVQTSRGQRDLRPAREAGAPSRASSAPSLAGSGSSPGAQCIAPTAAASASPAASPRRPSPRRRLGDRRRFLRSVFRNAWRGRARAWTSSRRAG